MPVETRTLLFDQEEMKEAVHDHILRREIASGESRLLGLEIEPESTGIVIASVAAAATDPARKIELTYGEVTDALIQLCRKHRIPLPRYGDKRLTPAGSGMALMVRIVFPRRPERA